MSFLGEAVVGVGADTSKFEGETKRAVESASQSAAKTMQKAGRGMTSVGKDLTAKVTLPIVAIAAASVKTAADFEQTMNVLQTATGAPARAMEQMRKQAVDLGADTVFSANEAAEAMLELGKAGLNSRDTMAAVPEVLNLAATEGLGLADAAGIVTSAMAPFQLKADEVGQAVNALAGASNASKASVSTLSQALKLVGGAAAGTGLSVQETTGALAALAQNGLEGGIAGTSLAGVLRRLQPETTKAKEAMKELGLNFVDAKGNFDSIDVVAGKLQSTFKGMAPAARQAALSKIFGNDASVMQAVNALINAGADGMRKFTKASSDQSAAQKLADARMKGLKGSIEAMKGSLETAGLAIGTILIPYVTKAADFIGNLADKFGTLSPEAQKIIIVVAGIAAAIGPVLIVVGTLITSIGAIAGVFAGLTAAVVAPIAAIALIAVGLGILFAKSEKARAVVTSAFGEIKTAIMEAVGPIVEMIQGQLMPAFEAMWPIIEKVGVIVLQVFAGAVVGAIKGAIQALSGIVQVITGIVQVVSGILTGDWSRVWDGMKNIIQGAFQAVVGIIRVWLNVGFLSIFRKGFGLLKGILTSGWNVAKGLFTKGVGLLRSVLQKITQILLAPFRAGFNVLKGVVQAGWNAIKAIFSAYTGAIRAILSAAMGAARAIVSGAIGAIKGIFSAGWNALKGIVSKAWSGIKSAISTGVTQAVNLVKSLPGKAVAALGDLGSKLTSAGVSLIQGFISGITSKIGDVKDTLGGLTSKLTSWKGPPKTDATILFNAGVLVIKGFVDGLESNIPLVREALGEFTALVSQSFSPPELGKALGGVTEAFNQINEDIATATQARADNALAASKKSFEQERKAIEKSAAQQEDALRKKYDGKKEEKKLRKKLDALERETDKSLRKLEGREKKAAREIEKTRKDNTSSLQTMAGAHRAAINSIANAWDAVDLRLNGGGGIRDQLAEARSTLESEIDKLQSYASNVGSRLVESVFKAPENPRLGIKFEDLVKDLQAQEAQAEAFGNVLADLAGMGLNATSYDQIASAGPEALAAAQALVNAGEAGIAQVNALQGSIDAYAQQAGDTAANYLYGAGVSAAQGVVDGLVAQETDLVAQMTFLGQQLALAMTAAIGAIQMPGAGTGGGGGGGGDDGKHKWVPKSDKNRNCKVCGRPRNAAIHTNRGEGHASGTLSAPGGWAMVGERGPELLNLPGGSRIYPAHQTERMVQKQGDTYEITLQMPTDDPEAVAEALMNRLARRGR